MYNSTVKLNGEHYIGGTWLMVMTSWIVESQAVLNLIATSGAIVLTAMGCVNYIRQWQKKDK